MSDNICIDTQILCFLHAQAEFKLRTAVFRVKYHKSRRVLICIYIYTYIFYKHKALRETLPCSHHTKPTRKLQLTTKFTLCSSCNAKQNHINYYFYSRKIVQKNLYDKKKFCIFSFLFSFLSTINFFVAWSNLPTYLLVPFKLHFK